MEERKKERDSERGDKEIYQNMALFWFHSISPNLIALSKFQNKKTIEFWAKKE